MFMELIRLLSPVKKINSMITKERIQSLNDLVFENRNKAYGAYDLRINYNKRLNRSFTIALSSISLLFLIFFLLKKVPDPIIEKVFKDQLDVSDPFVFQSQKIAQPIQPSPKQSEPKESMPKKMDPHSFLAVRDSIKIQPIVDTSTITINPDTSGHSELLASTQPVGPVKNNLTLQTKQSPFNQASVDKLPEFPGGMDRFYKYLVKKIRYTEEAKNAGLSGKIFISFVIDEEGMVSNIRILNGMGFGLDESVQEALKNSPIWNPGYVRNKAVKTEMILPVSFSLR